MTPKLPFYLRLDLEQALGLNVSPTYGQMMLEPREKQLYAYWAGYVAEHLKQEPIYRISIGTPEIEVDCYDLIENFAPELERVYTNLDEMPDWVKERIAVLMVLDPTQINEPIAGVGRRINKNVFWITK